MTSKEAFILFALLWENGLLMESGNKFGRRRGGKKSLKSVRRDMNRVCLID